MALFNKKQTKENKPFDKTNNIKKLKMYVTIVNRGQGDAITKLLEHLGVSAQFIQSGTGTASASIRDILGIEDNRKDVVISLIKEESIEDVKKELNAFFLASKRNKGVGFSIPMNSIIGVKVYQFLSNTL